MGRSINRKAWSINTCLSPITKPTNVNFSTKKSSNLTMYGIIEEDQKDGSSMPLQCLPLSTLILALGNPRVDFLSLDIEGAELAVLKTILWDKIDIRTISVETQFVELFDYSEDDVQMLLQSKGFLLLDQIGRDSVYVQMPRSDLLVPKRNLPTHSRAYTMKEVLQKTKSMYTLIDVLESYKYPVTWELHLSDSCMFI